MCTQFYIGCENGDFRLEDPEQMNGRIKGFAQYYYNNVWSFICASSIWSINETTVACRQLGYSDQGITSLNATKDTHNQ